MALMFDRVARNHATAGYFPTDDATLAMILSGFDFEDDLSAGVVNPDAMPTALAKRIERRFFDPCCGDGDAVLQLAAPFRKLDTSVVVHGVEFDEGRAWAAKAQPGMSQIAHADIADVVVESRSVGCLFLNPPYGDLVKDSAGLLDESSPFKTGRQRLEKMFFDRTFGTLQFGGVMVLIVPHSVIDEDFALKILRNFDELSWFMAPEQKFKQCVVIGRRVKTRHPPKALVDELLGFARRDTLHLSGRAAAVKYDVPVSTSPFKLRAVRIDAKQLSAELSLMPLRTLWPQFDRLIGAKLLKHRAWLCEPSPWHLALALAAGQVHGVVVAKSGRVLLIKGDTIKEKSTVNETETDSQGNVSTRKLMTDVFVPVIRALDFTPDSLKFGAIIEIR